MTERTPAEVGAQARALVDELAASGDPTAFAELLALSEHVGVSLGSAARTMAEQGSWSQVATYAGTSKQAAWSRWRR